MKKRPIALALGVLVAIVTLISTSCRKINEYTTLGGDLIPPIDNITTFDTTMDVTVFNDTFSLAMDSQYLARSEEHFLGKIDNDPFFGKTDARLFFQVSPTSFGTYPFPRKDSLVLDSVVLVLDYKETYGDSSVPQTINVYELDQSNNFTVDSVYLIRPNDFVYPPVSNPVTLGSRNVIPFTLRDSVKAFQDTTAGQLRIKLDTNFARRLMNYDTSNAYHTDSSFNTYFKGFALQSVTSGNSVMGFDLGGVNTKLAFYFKQPKKTGSLDSANVFYFQFTTGSAAANYVQRDYTGTPVAAAAGLPTSAPIAYIQNTPGSFATIKIPGLTGLSNRLVHRAELIVEELYDPSDTIFKLPEFLYMDAYDSSVSKYRTIPYDVTFDASGVINFGIFGAAPYRSTDDAGNATKTWRLNISRYVQHVLTNTQKAFNFRLFAPFTVIDQFGAPPTIPDLPRPVFINSTILKGRARFVGNTGPGDPNPHRMRLHIVYSKL